MATQAVEMSTGDWKPQGEGDGTMNDEKVRAGDPVVSVDPKLMKQSLQDSKMEGHDSAYGSEDDKSDIEAEVNGQLAHPDDEIPEEETPKKKKKKKKKSRSTKAPKPTGFEDYYVDPPITPAEYQEEESLYSSDKSFSDRFSLAVARYTNRRKFTAGRYEIFDKYMNYRGMSGGIKQFQGNIDENAPDKTTTDVAIEKSRYMIKDDTSETSVVDFDAVVRGFLTSYLPTICETEDTLAATQIIRNFLNYLLYHDVCPEYADQLYDAKASCDKADHQMPICADLVHKLPGPFNQACSLILGGHFQDTYLEDVEQAKALRLDPGMRREEADKIFLAGLAAHGTDEMVEAYQSQIGQNKICIVDRKTLYLEVTEACLPSADVLELYSLASQRSIPLTGTVKFQTWQHPHGPWPEMTPEELKVYKTASYKRDHFELCLEAELLPKMLVGTKVCCTFYETSFGLRYFDSIMGVLSPMYTWLDNDAIMDWVTPKEIPFKLKSEDGWEDKNQIVVGGNIPDYSEEKSDPGEKTAGEDDVPPELEKYEKGEDIVVTF